MFFIYLFISSFLVLGGVCLEPMCTKFAYDEQLLEKMIRMEITAEMKEETNKADKEKMMKSIAELQTEIADLKAVNEELRSLVDGLGSNVQKTKIVAFSANTARNENPDKGEILQFTDVTVNEGGGYNSESGIFTTPVQGLYMFHDQMCVAAGKDFYHAFVVDTTDMTRERYFNADQELPLCFTAVFSRHLKVGQKVHVKCREIHRNGTRLIDDSYRLNIFYGILVTEI